MRTQSRHTTTLPSGNTDSWFTKLVLLFIVLSIEPATAGPISERLDGFVSKPVDTVIASFGNPSINTPNRISYTFGSNTQGFALGLPSSVDRFPTSNGLAPQTFAAQQPVLPCLLDFEIDVSSKVVSVSYRGPGCYEVVYSGTVEE